MMKNFRMFKLMTIVICTLTFIYSCVEPFTPENITFEDLLVVEGRITNENSFQNIQLSRTFEIDTITTNPEKNALVYIIDDAQQVYNFTEIEDGYYQSDTEFSAISGKGYTLKIETNDGKKYTSTSETLPPKVPIDNIDYSVKTSNLGEEVVNITVSSFNSDNNANYYLYTYEETYKIIPPFWNAFELDVTNPGNPELVLKTEEDKICYNTAYSKNIIQTETASLAEDRVTNFSIREISTTDYILKHRYSILIKQYVQSLNSYNYYENLKTFSNSESVFSENQIGFFQGNISSETNPNENVIGFFEISSVSSKRIFFNRSDVIGDNIPNFFDTCLPLAPLVYDPFSFTYTLADVINSGDYMFYEEVTPTGETGPYSLVPIICGDCRLLGTIEQPDFWID